MRTLVSLLAVTFLAVLAVIFIGTSQSAMAGTGAGASSAAGGKGSASAPLATVTPTAPTPTSTHTPVPLPTGTAVCGASWFVEQSPSPGQVDNQLRGIDGTSSNDVWAVGSYLPSGSEGTSYKRAHTPAQWQVALEQRSAAAGKDSHTIVREDASPAYRTLIEHWNGTAWSTVTSPNSGENDNVLSAMTVLSSTDGWAVGYALNEFGIAQTLALHWNGAAWSVVATPDTTAYEDNELLSVGASSPTDAWAVGYSVDTDGVGHELIMHWDGTAWSTMAAPEPPDATNGDVLSGITVIAANDIWAGGMYINDRQSEKTLALHWDGTAWSIVTTPNIGLAVSIFYALDATGPNDVWAVGAYATDYYSYAPLAEHWDGTAWTIVFVPSEDANTGGVLYSVNALNTSDIWAVGVYGGYNSQSQSLSVHWDGTRWNFVEGISLGSQSYSVLNGVKMIAPDDVWAVGDYTVFNPVGQIQPATLTEHFGDVLATCSMQFTDVPEGNTFYDAVRYLACKGILSGYPCGGTGEPCDPQNNPYFRPNAGIVRGQLAKLVSNAAGFDDQISNETFVDVPYYSTYFDYVGRLVERGIVSGYACGGPGEPCYPYPYPPYESLYFRPNAPATRGQIAKIVASTVGYTGQPTGQTFQDVPPTHTFYTYTENLATLGVMSGYACGSKPSEPCVPPLNRPYFRPNANATRGQTAKIVEKTFFRGCALAGQ